MKQLLKILLIPAILITLAGMANGLHETLHYHYTKFEKLFPHAEKSYWKPLPDCGGTFEGSWVRKYKRDAEGNLVYPLTPAFAGSTTFLVFLTDAKHLLSELHRALIFAGFLVLLGKVVSEAVKQGWTIGLRWWVYMVFFFAAYLAHAVGFHLVYTIIF